MKYLLLLLLLFNNIVYCQCLKPNSMEGAIADTATTGIVLISKVGQESNPIGFAGTIILKGVSFYIKNDLSKENQKIMDDWGGAIWTGAAINNLMIMLSCSNPIALLAGISSLIYFKTLDC